MKLAGRKNEIKLLNDLLGKTESEFVTVYGRRRVGKAYLNNTKEACPSTLDFLMILDN